MSLFSVRMRSSREEQGTPVHISGAERIVAETDLERVAATFVQRAMQHKNGTPDFVNLSIERVCPEEIMSLEALPIQTCDVEDVEEGHRAAHHLLCEAGVSSESANFAIALLKAGPAPGGRVMRGAVLLDAEQPIRMEPDPHRGVRVSKLDWEPSVLESWCNGIGHLGIARPRVWEAIAIASKVTAQPEVIAELCWSDDQSYITGYVASQQFGYVRVTHLKPLGSLIGGRVFFIRAGTDIQSLISRLEKQPALVDRLPTRPYIEL
ncbi:6-carboxyhexanoate--CoA ligase (plasmid) [Alicyclobacillus fastidiosus]|uniref:6-carboxyhexanoate--CoA ligase n=1 Tax=Alicyclobacillus fastidiosus TaxID=392011 RepID=A0ABY6ZPF8_9BACL|nr:6-carboxyhexanoate--CoA ligase [Alicyclobacillus fastidiosus]WAH44779.1 6-carboxyhexanoate--CoA ligase [Alicyclobacillus fastidiosus]GMA65731.1 6-carboxyhexanoate--CoA ligase [Alicyclobacillus fastidiosus]GMA65904.1 6-carboxyhexanoate--CoA ligase [Alicyclobacillus fastidiosus]